MSDDEDSVKEHPNCDCTMWSDCPCNPADPTYDYEKGEVLCANCFGKIGEICDRCCGLNAESDPDDDA